MEPAEPDPAMLTELKLAIDIGVGSDGGMSFVSRLGFVSCATDPRRLKGNLDTNGDGGDSGKICVWLLGEGDVGGAEALGLVRRFEGSGGGLGSGPGGRFANDERRPSENRGSRSGDDGGTGL